MEKIVSLCKRRGFVFQSSEIYGGAASVWDYGPLGVELRKNVADLWWSAMVHARDDIEGLDAGILMHPRVWEASGHVSGFTDPLLECKTCKKRWRADHIEQAGCARKPSVAPGAHADCDLGEPRLFNLMFKTFMGPVEEDASVVYLRPETAQGSYVNFLNVQQTSRQRVPFGIAQLGKAFRNEITPGNFVFRTREFEQMELEFFVPPADAPQWYEYWLAERLQWYADLGIPAHQLRLRAHEADELSHYSSGTSDVEYLFPWGWGELEGIANRGDYDLRQHAEHSGQKLEYFDQASGERYVPHVIEPAAGATRALMAFLLAAFREETVNDELRTVLGLHPRLAPYKAAVLPLSRKEPLPALAGEVLAMCQPHWMCDYDETQAIGRRYRRQDEIGTPLCVTVDFESVDDRCVTVRDRDTMAQDRVPIDALVDHLGSRLGL